MGMFDGCHLGHRAVVAETVRWAGETGVPAVAITFDPHPRTLAGGTSPALGTLAERVDGLRSLGIGEVCVMRFDRRLQEEPALLFARRIFRDRFGASGVALGHSARFGRDRGGDAAWLAAWGAAEGIAVRAVPPVVVDGAPASSSRVRGAVGGGRMEEAARLLGRPWSVAGTVARGQALARRLGLPTLNIAPPPDRLSPPAGVYAGWVWLREPSAASLRPGPAGEAGAVGREAVLHVGARPGGGLPDPPFEAHVFGLEGERYGWAVEFGFGGHLRAPVRFADEEEARRQLALDAEAARRWHLANRRSGFSGEGPQIQPQQPRIV